MAVRLGEKVKDNISGLEGIVMGRTEYLHGCVKILVAPEGLDKDGKPRDEVWMDEQRVTMMPSAKSGGPMPLAPGTMG